MALDLPAFGPPTIGPDQFGAVLQAAQSPVLGARPAQVYYDLIRSYGLDPAFLLAIFKHESGYGTNPLAVVNRYGTRNWGNTRSIRKPGLAGAVIDTDRGRFVRYSTWLDSLDDACYRLGDTAFDYARAGARTVAGIIPIWSPAGDQDNRPDSYAAAVVQAMISWGAKVANYQFADRVQILPPGSNRPGTRLRGFHAFVVHETDNEKAGATAAMHANWLRDSRPDASFHLCADQLESVLILPVTPADAEVGWHIGDGADDPDDESNYTIGGEICVNSRSGFPAACRRMAKSAAAILRAHNAPVIDGVTLRQHGSYHSARNPGVHQGCPRHLKAGDWGVTWPQFVAMVKAEWAALAPPAKTITETPPNPLYDPVTGLWIGDVLYGFWAAGGGVVAYGHPLEPMRIEADGVYRQLFENVLLGYYPDKKLTRLEGLGQLYKKVVSGG